MNSNLTDDKYCPMPSDTAYGNGRAFVINPDGTTQSPSRTADDSCVVVCDGPQDDDTLYPHPNACDRFCQCFQGLPINMACPKGLRFDPNPSRCEYPEDPIPECTPECPLTAGPVVDPGDTAPGAPGETSQEL